MISDPIRSDFNLCRTLALLAFRSTHYIISHTSCSWALVGIKFSKDEMRTTLWRMFPTSMHDTALSPEDLVYIINVYNNPSKLFLMLPNNCPLTVGADLELGQQLRQDFKTKSDKTFLKNKSKTLV